MPNEKMDESNVIQNVTFLENDNDQKLMRDTMVDRWAYYSLLDDADLPEHMTRGDSVSANTPFIGWLTDAIIADVTGYPTFATVIPVPSQGRRPTPDEQQLADRLEKWCNLLLQDLNQGKANERDMRWHQLNSAYCVPLLRCRREGDDGSLRFSLEVPAPETCFFPIGPAPARPKYLARRYKVLARDVQRTYANRRGSKPGYRPIYNQAKTWEWEQIGDDADVDRSFRGQGTSSLFEEVEMLYLDDGEHTYHLALNGNASGGGQIMWCDENRTGGVSAMILPGRVTPLRGADRYWPGLYPIYQMVKLINRLRAKRETRSDQLHADVFVEKDPETIKATTVVGGADPAQAAAIMEMQNGPNIIEVGGKPVAVPVAEDPDLDRLEERYWSELKMYADSLRETTSAEDMAQSTANAYLAWSDTKKKQQAPMLDGLAFVWAEILKMCIAAVQSFDEDYELMADGDLEYGRGKKVAAGEAVTLSAADLRGFNFKLKVETKSMTEQEIRFRVQDWAERKALGLATKREGVTAAGYSDEQAQLQALFEEAGQELATPFIEEQVKLAITERIRLKSRMLVNLGQQTAPAVPAGNANTFQPMEAPMIPAPVGTSAGGAPL